MDNNRKNEKPEGKVIRFPGPKKASSAPAEPATFKSFHKAAAGGDIESAGAILAQLLEIPMEAARDAAKFYSKRFAEDNSHVLRTMLLRSEIKSGLVNTILVLLRECFGLEGQNALLAYNCLKSAVLREET